MAVDEPANVGLSPAMPQLLPPPTSRARRKRKLDTYPTQYSVDETYGASVSKALTLGETQDQPIPLDDGDDDSIETTSIKKARTRKATRTAKTIQVDEHEADTPAKKAKRGNTKSTQPENNEVDAPAKKKASKGKGKSTEEKRPRRYRAHPPQSFLEVKDRALTQRMFVIDRRRGGTEDCPEESVDIAGTTGNIYTVNISQLPNCTCPHAKKGNQCKHIVYVLIRVLKVLDQLQYQLSFLCSELRGIFARAPPIFTESAAGDKTKDGNRKPVDGDCPICCMEYEPEREEVVYCKAACGNNIHKHCFEQWAASRKGAGPVTCPFCRTPWVGDEDSIKKIAKSGMVNAEGYVNVASQLGISGERDYSTYHPFWVRQQARLGNIDEEWADFGRWGSD